MSVMSPLTKTTVDENRKDSYDYNFGRRRLHSGSSMPPLSATSELFGSCRHNTHTHTPQRKASHYWPTLHCTPAVIQTWRLHAISWLDHRGRKAYTYATFIEAGMVATHGALRHSTNNRISFLDQDARCWNCIRLHSLQAVTVSPQPTGSWSQDQLTSHWNFAMQLRYLRARGHKSFQV